VLEGLSETPKRLPSRYFYDDVGSTLFAKIMQCEDYYPTKCEFEILTQQGADIVQRLSGRPLNLVDLGSGTGEKTLVLLKHFAAAGLDVRYVPIDISEEALRLVTRNVLEALPDQDIQGLVAEYNDGVRRLSQVGEDRANVVLFLGSNLGNFTRVQARKFLRQLWNLLHAGDYLFTGFDLKKDIDVLLRAYNDREGLTRDFNLNLLTRVNRELGGTFDLSGYRHYGTYDVLLGAMKSYLVSLRDQTVYIDALQHAFEFREWEPIHTEYSYKYLDRDIDELAADTGFELCSRYYDERRYFCDALWRVRGRNVVGAG